MVASVAWLLATAVAKRTQPQLDRLSNRISAEDRKRVERVYKKACHVRRACNTINGIARARAYSDQIE